MLPKSCRTFVQTFCFLFSVAAPFLALGADARLNRLAINIPERGEVLGYAVSVGTNHFRFIPPPEWRVATEPGAAAVVMMSPDLTTSIKIDFLEGTLVRGRQKNRHEKLIAARYPSSTPRERFDGRTGLGEGPASDITRPAGDGSVILSRVIHARSGLLVVEFALTAPAQKFPERTAIFAHLVNSFEPATRAGN